VAVSIHGYKAWSGWFFYIPIYYYLETNTPSKKDLKILYIKNESLYLYVIYLTAKQVIVWDQI
jgi:hypothetical protein